MNKLDTNKPHGTISGTYEVYPEARYTQAGKFYDAKGDLIDERTKQEDDEGHGQGHDDGQNHDDGSGHDQTDGQENAQAGNESTNVDARENEEGHVLETSKDSNVMDKTDEELVSLAASGMGPLRKYAEQFGVKGISKAEIIEELKALR